MKSLLLLSLLLGVTSGLQAGLPARSRVLLRSRPIIAQDEPSLADEVTEAASEGAASAPQKSKQFDLKGREKERASQGAGFNQFDPVLSASSFVSRRFGLAGGLALVGLLAAVEGNEILKSFTDNGPQPCEGAACSVKKDNGLAWKDVMIGSDSDTISTQTMGSIVGLKIKVMIGDKLLYDTASEKPVAFKYGKRPFENVLCEGVEQGIKGMKVGGVRELDVPQTLAPKGLELPEGVGLQYVVEVTEILPGYF